MTNDELADRLSDLGFCATANDVLRGLSWEEVMFRLRRDARNRQPDNRAAALELAAELNQRETS